MDKGLGPSLSNIHRVMPSIAVDVVTLFSIINLAVPSRYLLSTKESNSTANESKWQYNRSIIYSLNIVSIVNDSFWNKKKQKKRKVELPGLKFTAGEVFRSCQSWTLYHCATKLRQFLLLKFFIKNVSTGKTVVFTLAALFFTLVFILLFIPSQHYREIRYFNWVWWPFYILTY